MAESVYKVIELVGTSTDSWEKAAKAAVDRAAKTLRDLRVAEDRLLDATNSGCEQNGSRPELVVLRGALHGASRKTPAAIDFCVA